MVNSATKDNWDWPFIIYTGINWLGYTEEEVWKLTPRKWNALVSVHLELLTKRYGGDTSSKRHSSSNAPTGYIDQLNW